MFYIKCSHCSKTHNAPANVDGSLMCVRCKHTLDIPAMAVEEDDMIIENTDNIAYIDHRGKLIDQPVAGKSKGAIAQQLKEHERLQKEASEQLQRSTKKRFLSAVFG